MGKLIQWDEIYCFQKCLPLLTRWQLFHMGDDGIVIDRTQRGSVQPDFIKKKRTPKGVPSVEIVWKDEHGCFDCLIPHEQLNIFYSTHKEKSETEAFQILWSTIEPIDLVEKAYPDLIRQFEEAKVKGKPKKSKKVAAETTKAKKTKTHQVLSTLDDNAIEPAEKVQMKKSRSKQIGKQSVRRAGAVDAKNKVQSHIRPIDQFFRKETVASTYSSPKIQTTAKPMNLSAFSMGLGDSFDLVENDDMNLSEIISEMVLRPPNLTEYRGKKLQYDEIACRAAENDERDDGSGTGAAAQIKSNDESIDEFDLIVMRKARKSLLARKASILSANSSGNRFIGDCSTPVLSKRPCTRLGSSFKSEKDFQPNSPVGDAGVASTHEKSTISTSFFAIHPNDDVDLFEKSIDFRNMCDDDSEHDSDNDDESDEIKNSKSDDDDKNDNNCDFNEYDTFDRLVGID